jgi:hypothetical protein
MPKEISIILCKGCGGTIEPDEAVNIDNELFCADCVFFCSCCGTFYYGEQGSVIDGEFVCDDCICNYYTRCRNCEGWIDTRADCISVGSGFVCRDCYDEDYFTCDCCDRVFHNDNYGDSGYCVNCNEPDSDCDDSSYGSEYISQWDFRPMPLFHRTTSDETNIKKKVLYLGVELEVDNGSSHYELAEDLQQFSDNGRKFYLKTDGSLNCGIEIVSHPMTLAYHKAFCWRDVFKKCLSYGFRSHNTKTCGIHCHIPRNFLSDNEAVKLALFINTNKTVISKVARRSACTYSNYKLIRKGNLKYANDNRDEGRYQAINWLNPRTIEFRFFRGTLKYDTFIACLEFLHSLCHFIKTVNTQQVYSAEYTNCMNGKAFRLYCKYLKQNSKEYKLVISYLKSKGVFICV